MKRYYVLFAGLFSAGVLSTFAGAVAITVHCTQEKAELKSGTGKTKNYRGNHRRNISSANPLIKIETKGMKNDN
jgi:hypothetical protein